MLTWSHDHMVTHLPEIRREILRNPFVYSSIRAASYREGGGGERSGRKEGAGELELGGILQHELTDGCWCTLQGPRGCERGHMRYYDLTDST